MPRRHGWAGSPPADEAEARQRIIEAAMRCVDRLGPERFSLAEVAADLGVIRQTVYRYFPSTDELFEAVGGYAVEAYIDELTRHLRRHKEPAPWVVEALAATIEWLPDRPHLTLLLAAGHPERFAEGVTSPVSMAVGREIFKRSPIDWAAAGYDPRDIDELIELMLRIMGSMVTHPASPPRSSRELRRVLRGWIGPR